MFCTGVAGVKDVTVSLPNLMGGNGIISTFYPDLSEKEYRALRESASIIRNALDELEEASV